MTRKRDRYQSAFDGNVPGPQSAIYDMGIVLYLLFEWAEKQGLLDEQVHFWSGVEQRTVAQLLKSAQDALNTSVDPTVQVYRRLQENAEAMDVLSQALDGENWKVDHEALALTLKNKAIVSRGLVTRCRREIDRRAREGGDAG